MIRTFLGTMAIALLASGCCGTSCGPGCGPGHCYDCNGGSMYGAPMAGGPMDHLRDARRKLVCGSGCGETYRGEWMSTPPDCNDPCCGGQFTGGAVAAQPFCWQPGSILGGLAHNLYGGRHCGSCGDNYGACGCGGGAVGGSVQGAVGCGCATCNSQNGATTRMAKAQSAQARSAKRPAKSPSPTPKN